MEKSDRSVILHKIRKKEDGEPVLRKLSAEVTKKTKDFIEAFNPVGDPIKKLREIYKAVDLIMADREDETVCRSGCAHCCRISVDATPLEVRYITLLTPYNAKPVKGYQLDYCPFLDQQTACCRIYEFRPFSCRAFVVYDSPDYCANDEAHFTSGGPVDSWGSEALKILFKMMAVVGMGFPPTKKKYKKLSKNVKDIREWFPSIK